LRRPPGAGPGRLLPPGPVQHAGRGTGLRPPAAGQSWRSVVVVSSRYHLLRARMLFDRCYDGTVNTAPSKGTLWGRILAAPIETVKLGYALLIKRQC
jgi:hypothetical protein